MNVYVNVAPAAIPLGATLLELKLAAPEGTEEEKTVWGALSLFVHTTVLFTPMTTTMVSGEKNVLDIMCDWFQLLGGELAPDGIIT